MSPQSKFVIFCIILGFIAFAMISSTWNANSFFASAYRPVIEESAQRQEAAQRARDGKDPSKPSSEPHAPGFKEGEIEKERGHRYATY